MIEDGPQLDLFVDISELLDAFLEPFGDRQVERLDRDGCSPWLQPEPLMLSAKARLDRCQLHEVFLMKPLAATRSIIELLQRVPELLDDFAENRLW